jgi:transmembrane sensor
MVSGADKRESLEDVAARWVVRGFSPDLTQSDLLELAVWLEASEAHAEAYAGALKVWSELSAFDETPAEPAGHVPEESALVQQLSVGLTRLETHRARKQVVTRRLWVGGAASAIAACLALFVVWPQINPQAPFDVYETAKGQNRAITLADGTDLTLNTDTRVSVQMTPKGRRLVLDHGEIGLKVVHDASRPFTVEAGEVTATDIGTQFNVRRTDAQVRVSVTEGEVELAARTQAIKPVRLRRGDVGMHAEGAMVLSQTRVNPDDVFAWTHQHAIYRDETLGEVVKDLNRYFDKPISVDARTANIRLTAIMTLDSETSVVGRLQDYLSLDAKTTDQGITLYQRDVARPGGAGASQ